MKHEAQVQRNGFGWRNERVASHTYTDTKLSNSLRRPLEYVSVLGPSPNEEVQLPALYQHKIISSCANLDADEQSLRSSCKDCFCYTRCKWKIGGDVIQFQIAARKNFHITRRGTAEIFELRLKSIPHASRDGLYVPVPFNVYLMDVGPELALAGFLRPLSETVRGVPKLDGRNRQNNGEYARNKYADSFKRGEKVAPPLYAPRLLFRGHRRLWHGLLFHRL